MSTSVRIIELQDFYRDIDEHKVKNVVPLFEKFSFREIVDAVDTKYGQLPPGWEKIVILSKKPKDPPPEPKSSTIAKVMKRMSFRPKLPVEESKPPPPRAKPVPPTPPVGGYNAKPPAPPPKSRPVSSRMNAPAPIQPGGKPPPPPRKTTLERQKPVAPPRVGTLIKDKPSPPSKPKTAERGNIENKQTALGGMFGASSGNIASKQAALGGIFGGGNTATKPAAGILASKQKSLAGKVGGKVAKTASPVVINTSNKDLELLPLDHPDMEKYKKMQKSGLPEGAVINCMERDGVDPDSLFGASQAAPTKTTVPMVQKAAPPIKPKSVKKPPAPALKKTPAVSLKKPPAPVLKKPVAPDDDVPWVIMWSDQFNHEYFYNKDSGESTWEDPTGGKAKRQTDIVQESVYGVIQYDFIPSGSNEEEIALHAGEMVQIMNVGVDGWNTGYTQDGRYGLFPSSYCQVQS